MIKILKTIALLSFTTSALFSSSIGVCKGCHGKNFSNSVDGTSKEINKMDKKEIISALKGYKNGSYGGAMKSVMEAQVKALSLDDIGKLADLIKK